MSRFVLTVLVLILCACVAVSALSPSSGRDSCLPFPMGEGATRGWLDTALAGVISVVTPASAAELCVVPSYDINGICNAMYGSHRVGWGFQTVEDTTRCRPSWGNEHVCVDDALVWSISSSSTEARQNTGPLPLGGELFLWLYANCYGDPCSQYGYSGDHIRFEGDLLPVSYQPIVGTGTLTADGLFLGNGGCIPCVGPWTSPLLVGRLTVSGPTAVESTTESTTWGRIKATYH